MTREQTINKLTEMFIEKYGEQEVRLSNKIKVRVKKIGMYENTTEYIRSIRQKDGMFEMYIEDAWYGSWREDQEAFEKCLFDIMSDCLGIYIETKVDYFIREKENSTV